MPRKSYSIEERQRVKEALMTTVLQCIVDRGLIHMQTSLLLWAANKAVSDLSSFYRTIKQIKTVQPQL